MKGRDGRTAPPVDAGAAGPRASGGGDRPRGDGRALAIALGAFVVSLAALLAVFRLWDWDVWFHLAYGREVLAQRALPRVDPFTLASAGSSCLNGEWLFGVLLHLVERAGGIPGVTLFKALIVAATFLLLFLDARGPRRAAVAATLAVGLALVAARGRFYERPEIFMLLFVALEVALLDRFLRRGGRGIWLLPLVQLAWVNLHPSAVLGPALIAAFLSGSLLLAGLGRLAGTAPAGAATRRRAGVLAAVLALVTGASGLNPTGFKHLTAVVDYVAPSLLGRTAATSPAVAAGDVARHYIAELKPLQLGDLKTAFGALLLLTALALFVWLASRARRVARREGAAPGAARLVAALDLDLVRVPLAAFAVAQALKANRFVALAAVLLAPLAARLFAAAWAGRPHWPARRTAAAAALVAAALVGLGAVELARSPFMPGLGVHPSHFPDRATQWMLATGVKGPLLNTLHFGGFLEWAAYRRIQPVLDGRGCFAPELLEPFVQAQVSPPHFAQVEARFAPQAAIFYYPTLDPSLAGALGALAVDRIPPGWALVYWDDAAMVLVREDGPNAAIARRHALRSLQPIRDYYVPIQERLADPATLAAVTVDAERASAAAPHALRPALLVARLAGRAGDHERATRLAEEVRRRSQAVRGIDDVRFESVVLLARSAEKRGDRARAITLFEEAGRRNPRSGEVRYRRGMLLEELGRHAEAAKAFRDALAASPRLTDAQRRLARALKASGDAKGAAAAEAQLGRLESHGAAEDRFHEGTRLYQAGDLAGAMAAFQASVDINPRSAPALSNLGYVLLDLNRLAEALDFQRRAVEVDPGYANAHYGLGLIYQRQGLREQARTHLGRYLALSPRGYYARRAEMLLQSLAP
ncbi:MAG: tetratricopeptide repeat protein [Deltaproteobacteria bacterium]|nr:tetratricopeptide repeat protein [Deltaproteobacteria bacterium]